MNNQIFIKREKEKIENLILQVIENVWLGRTLLLLIMSASLGLFIWAAGLRQQIYATLILFLGALLNFGFSLSENKKIRDIAIFFAMMISICFLFIALIAGAFFIILNKANH